MAYVSIKINNSNVLRPFKQIIHSYPLGIDLLCCCVLVILFEYLASPQGLFHSLREFEFNGLIAGVAVLKLKISQHYPVLLSPLPYAVTCFLNASEHFLAAWKARNSRVCAGWKADVATVVLPNSLSVTGTGKQGNWRIGQKGTTQPRYFAAHALRPAARLSGRRAAMAGRSLQQSDVASDAYFGKKELKVFQVCFSPFLQPATPSLGHPWRRKRAPWSAAARTRGTPRGLPFRRARYRPALREPRRAGAGRDSLAPGSYLSGGARAVRRAVSTWGARCGARLRRRSRSRR